VRPRIFGIETEYGLMCKTEDRWGLDSPTLPTVIGHLFETTDLRNTSSFLKNGARLYLDTGTHPEYATPECDDIMELIAHVPPRARSNQLITLSSWIRSLAISTSPVI
jgi:proteasome accessory factor A